MAIKITTTTTNNATVASSPKIVTVYPGGASTEYQQCSMIVPELGEIDILTAVGNLDALELGETSDLATAFGGSSSPWTFQNISASLDSHRKKIYLMA